MPLHIAQTQRYFIEQMKTMSNLIVRSTHTLIEYSAFGWLSVVQLLHIHGC